MIGEVWRKGKVLRENSIESNFEDKSIIGEMWRKGKVLRENSIESNFEDK